MNRQRILPVYGLYVCGRVSSASFNSSANVKLSIEIVSSVKLNLIFIYHVHLTSTISHYI